MSIRANLPQNYKKAQICSKDISLYLYFLFCYNKIVIVDSYAFLPEDLLTKVKKKIQKFKQHKNGAPKQATLHLKFQMVAVRRC